MQTEAIRSDVSAEGIPADSQPTRELSPREAAMAALIQNRDADLAGGNAGSTDDLPTLYGTTDDPWNETGSQAAAQVAQATAQNDPASPVFSRDGEQYMKIKVNGIEQEIPLAQVQATIQKNVAADSRLQEASNRMREVEARERQFQEQQTQMQQRPPQAGVDNADSEALRAEAKAIINGLYEGETDDASERLARLLAGRNAPTVNMAHVQQQAEAAALRTIEHREFKTDLTKGRAEFDAQYPEIIGDPELFSMADQKTIRISQNNPDWTPTRVLMEAGKEVKQWLSGQRGESQAQPAENARQANKQALRPMPTAQRNAAHVAPRAAAVDNSAAGVLGRMRAGRGQH
jgi:hypothetical protein